MERYGGGHLGRSCDKGRLKCFQNVTLPNNIIATIDFEFRVKLSWFSGNIQKTERVQPPRLLQVNLHLLQTKFWFEISISAGHSVLWKRAHTTYYSQRLELKIIQAFPGQHFSHLQSRLCGHHPGHSYGWSDLQLLNFRATMFPQVRVQTTGIIEYNFPLEFRKNLTRDCIFIDVGGQRNERKKWSG